jgi:hypothetical protein
VHTESRSCELWAPGAGARGAGHEVEGWVGVGVGGAGYRGVRVRGGAGGGGGTRYSAIWLLAAWRLAVGEAEHNVSVSGVLVSDHWCPVSVSFTFYIYICICICICTTHHEPRI